MTKPKCKCPPRCPCCGARRRKDAVGHYCPTLNCQWHYGYPECMIRDEPPVRRRRNWNDEPTLLGYLGINTGDRMVAMTSVRVGERKMEGATE